MVYAGCRPASEPVRNVQERRQKNLILILAREFASKLATATFIADADGNLVFYNEATEDLLGRTFAEAGEMSAAEGHVVSDVVTESAETA